jgi:protein tyrosine/serine phosphatase
MKRTLAALLALVMLMLSLCACAEKKASVTVGMEKDKKFDSADLDIDSAGMEEAGFAYGDSVDLVFSNGYTLTDVPYFNGYYVRPGEPVMVAYPGFDYVLVAVNYGAFWSAAKLTDECTVEITLNTAGKYKATYEALSQNYSFDRDEYDTDEQFANFRAMKGGNLKENFLYRGASPVDNSRDRAPYTDALLEANNIAAIVDLADSEEDMQSFISAEDFASPYTLSLYEQGKVILLDMGSSFDSDAYKQSVAAGLRFIMQNEGPVYIHCMEGKDRTGFVCALIEALMGASYDEMRADYMQTYANYYGVTEDGTPERYTAVKELYFDAFMEYFCGLEDPEALKTADYTEGAKAYLTAAGMTEEEISALIDFLSK